MARRWIGADFSIPVPAPFTCLLPRCPPRSPTDFCFSPHTRTRGLNLPRTRPAPIFLLLLKIPFNIALKKYYLFEKNKAALVKVSYSNNQANYFFLDIKNLIYIIHNLSIFHLKLEYLNIKFIIFLK